MGLGVSAVREVLLMMVIASAKKRMSWWSETSVGTFWKRPDVKRVMETLLHFLFQTAVAIGVSDAMAPSLIPPVCVNLLMSWLEDYVFLQAASLLM